MEDLDIWRSAQKMIDTFGEDAPVAAGNRAETLARDGDLAGLRIWRLIIEVIDKLQRQDASAGGSRILRDD
ncbi:MAG TPA: hypothetical protein VHZ32_03290 [Rhizomicrobium sp.]|jgi:hypothetical protein|nr:hypothetical protein [Rhizomicrobium sp.]